MTAQNQHGRLAGLLYLIVVTTGIFSLAYVPSQISVPNDPQATAANIVSMEQLFRWGIASFMVMQVAFLLLPLALFQLLRTVNLPAALLMVVLAFASVPAGMVSLAHRLDALTLLTDPYFSQALSAQHVHAAAKASLDSYGSGLLVTSLFWGLWLLPFGYLVLKSGFLPRILGGLLMLGFLGYMVNVFGRVLMPDYSHTIASNYAGIPASVGEIGICLWLLFVGARLPQEMPPGNSSKPTPLRGPA